MNLWMKCDWMDERESFEDGGRRGCVARQLELSLTQHFGDGALSGDVLRRLMCELWGFGPGFEAWRQCERFFWRRSVFFGVGIGGLWTEDGK